MSLYQRYVLPHLLHLAMRQEMLLPFRHRVIGAAEGRVLEVGIGSGLNLPLYGPPVRAVVGLEPSPELLRMARDRAVTARVAVELLDASAEAIPLDTASIEAVVPVGATVRQKNERFPGGMPGQSQRTSKLPDYPFRKSSSACPVSSAFSHRSWDHHADRPRRPLVVRQQTHC
jgi:SAM-dependent methyltransferase